MVIKSLERLVILDNAKKIKICAIITLYGRDIPFVILRGGTVTNFVNPLAYFCFLPQPLISLLSHILL